MTNENASAILEFLCASLESEIAITRSVLAAVPDDKADYTPHPTSMTAMALAVHMATIDVFFIDGLVKGEFGSPDGGEDLKKPSDIVAYYDAKMPGLLTQLKAVSGEQIAKSISVFGMNLSGLQYLNVMLMHGSHHRGQLSTYLRPMGAKVPAIYGSSADSQAAGA